jgi:hypothetical protein
VTVLVPSYQEDERVIRTTLLSAALQEHPHLRVVLLIDDPIKPTNATARQQLEAARALPGSIAAELAVPLARAADALDQFEHQQASTVMSAPRPTCATLAGHYRDAIDLAARAWAPRTRSSTTPTRSSWST